LPDIEEIHLDVCSCCPAAIELLEQGLFPSAPIHLSLTVEMEQLNLISIFFMTTALNIMGWTEMLGKFLGK
jgi:CxC1 like cysteine cluster associated with KDZ transposases